MLIAALILLDVFFLGWVVVDKSVLQLIEEIGNSLALPDSLL